MSESSSLRSQSSPTVTLSETSYPLWEAFDSVIQDRLGQSLLNTFHSKRLDFEDSDSHLFYQTFMKHC